MEFLGKLLEVSAFLSLAALYPLAICLVVFSLARRAHAKKVAGILLCIFLLLGGLGYLMAQWIKFSIDEEITESKILLQLNDVVRRVKEYANDSHKIFSAESFTDLAWKADINLPPPYQPEDVFIEENLRTEDGDVRSLEDLLTREYFVHNGMLVCPYSNLAVPIR